MKEMYHEVKTKVYEVTFNCCVRFASIRGYPQMITYDSGSQLIGLNVELRDTIKELK